MLSSIDSDDNIDDYNYLRQEQDQQNWRNEYEFPSNGRNNYYNKRRTSSKVVSNSQHMTQTNSPNTYFREGESQNIQMNYGKVFYEYLYS